MPVRIWLLLSIFMCVVTIVLTYNSAKTARDEQWLFTSGAKVDAKVLRIGLSKARNAPRDEALDVDLEFTLPGAKDVTTVQGFLSRKPGGNVKLDEIIPIHVDPNNPKLWTDLEKPIPFSIHFATLFGIVPITLLCLLGTWYNRSAMLKTYRNGTVRQATVLSTRLPALAPASKLVKFVLNEGDDLRIYQLYIPNHAEKVTKDDVIDILVASNPKRAIAVSAYV